VPLQRQAEAPLDPVDLVATPVDARTVLDSLSPVNSPGIRSRNDPSTATASSSVVRVAYSQRFIQPLPVGPAVATACSARLRGQSA
jgi:hypothetical protein